MDPGILRIERGDRLIGVDSTVIDMLPEPGIPEMGFLVSPEHSRVYRRCELLSLSHHSRAVCPPCSPLRLVPTSCNSHSLGSMRNMVIHLSPGELRTLTAKRLTSSPGERDCHSDVLPAPNVRFTDASRAMLNTTAAMKRGQFFQGSNCGSRNVTPVLR